MPSCKKGDGETTMVCNHDTTFASMKDWCYFKEGTWWVYQEENSGDLDTVFVYQSNVIDHVELFKYRSSSTYYENDFIYEHDLNWVGPSNVSACTIKRLYRTQSSSGNFIGGGLIANFPPILGELSDDVAPGVSDGVKTVSIDSTLTTETMEFNDCVYYTVGTAGSEDFVPLNVFFKRNIGIVRKELPDNNTYWNLVDYHIIQ